MCLYYQIEILLSNMEADTCFSDMNEDNQIKYIDKLISSSNNKEQQERKR